MPARGSAGAGPILGLVILLPLSGLTFFWGSASLWNLAAIYQPADLARTETPLTLRSWLAAEWTAAAVDNSGNRSSMARGLAARLQIMSLQSRRDAVLAMMNDGFWQVVAGKTGFRSAKAMASEAFESALLNAPTSGDLYLGAAWLRLTTTGFSPEVVRLLRNAQLLAPREYPFVRTRAQLLPAVWPLLDEEARSALLADLAIVKAAQPGVASQIILNLPTGIAVP